MRDSLNTLFHDRFQGHELPVDPGVWQGITQQMANATVSTADGLSDLFKDRFQGHETAVDPAVWKGISAQLGHAAVGTTAGSGLLGWAAAGVLAVTVGAVAYFSIDEPKTTVGEVLPMAPTEQVTPVIPVEAPVAQFTDRTLEHIVQGSEEAQVPAIRGEQARARIEPSHEPASVGPDPALSVTSPNPTVQAPLPIEEGAAVVESIIADITTEAKQQVLDQRVRPLTPTEPEQPLPSQDVTQQDTQVPAMPELFVPNIFTPNGDGPNDVYQIGSEGFDHVLIRVYSVKDNRLVFSTNNRSEHWTGANCEDGMYLVAVEARTPDGRTATEGKVVWLNRNP